MRQQELQQPECQRGARADQRSDEGKKLRGFTQSFLGSIQLTGNRQPREKLYCNQEQSQPFTHYTSLSVTPASVNVAISASNRAADVMTIIARAAPVPSPSRSCKSSKGDCPMNSISELCPFSRDRCPR